jgi:hypothetical protein
MARKRHESMRAAGTSTQDVTVNAALIAAVRPNENMYRVPGGETNAGVGSQPAPAPTNVVSWMSTIGHLSPGPGTADQSLDTDATPAEVAEND